MTPPVRIGTRRSKLALAQAEEVAARLRSHGVDAELLPMSTSGDRGSLAGPGSPAGVKGLFVDDIVEFGLTYAATVREDHRHFVEAFREGRIRGVSSA